MKPKNWKDHAALAENYLAVGQREVYLSDGDERPWEHVVSVEPGGSHRLEMATSVWFRATHPSGLGFRWSFDIEPRGENGNGYYEVDVNACHDVLARLPSRPAAQFKAYLSECAKKVKANAQKFKDVADREFETARALERASLG